RAVVSASCPEARPRRWPREPARDCRRTGAPALQAGPGGDVGAAGAPPGGAFRDPARSRPVQWRRGLAMNAPAAARGFTLLELLAAMALLALLMLGVWSGIRTAAQTSSRGRAVVDRLDRRRGGQRSLRRNPAQATPVPWARVDDGRPVVFHGGPHRMRFVAPLPGFLGRMGPQWQALELVPDGEDSDRLRLQVTFARLS